MNILTYQTWLDLTETLPSRAWRGIKRLAKKKNSEAQDEPQGPTPDTRLAMATEALKRYDNIVGRFDSPDKVPSRNLVAPADEREEKKLRKRGGVKNEQGDWVVPEHIKDLSPFEFWWPLAPEDLRDRKPRLLTTRDGQAIENYVRPEDRGLGSDSTATSLMYGGLTAVSILIYLAASFWGPLAIPVALLYTPFVLAISHGEGPLEALKSWLVAGLLPLVFAGGSGMLPFLDSLLVDAKSASSGLGAIPYLGALPFFGPIALAFLGALFFQLFDTNAQNSMLKGAFEKFKTALIWGFAIYAAYKISGWVLPDFLMPAFYFSLAGAYAMVYTNGNAVVRSKWLQHVGKRFNLGRSGSLSSAHIEPKKAQAKRALEDKSPLFDIGRAIGWLTNKFFPYAPDAGVWMRLSVLDLTKHLLVFGETGSGKTASVARRLAKQWVEAGIGGLLILCGKGSLAGDVAGLLTLRIREGMNFAAFKGLDAHGATVAINSMAKIVDGEPKDPYWRDMADSYVQRTNLIWEALKDHELTYKRYAKDMAKLKELEITRQQVVIAELTANGDDTTAATALLQTRQSEHDRWAKIRDGGRKWKWNGSTCKKVWVMANTCVQAKGSDVWEAGPRMKEAVAFLGYNPNAEDRRIRRGEPVHPEIGTGGLLDDALEFVLTEWVTIAPQTRGSIIGNVLKRLDPLLSAPYLIGANGVHWKDLEDGEDAGSCLYGGNVGVDLPKEKHQAASILIQALVQQRIYGKVSLRGGNENWREEGQKELLILMDEAQDIFSTAEVDLLPKARSLGCRFVALTQGYESIEAKLGDQAKTAKLCSSFLNLICMESSPQTYEYMARRLGTAQLLTYNEPSVGLDMNGGVQTLAASALNDPNHPNKAVMRKLLRKGAGRLVPVAPATGSLSTGWRGHRQLNIDDDQMDTGIDVRPGGKLVVQPLFKPEEFSALLTKGRAIVMLKRADEKRIDVCDLPYIGPDELRVKKA